MTLVFPVETERELILSVTQEPRGLRFSLDEFGQGRALKTTCYFQELLGDVSSFASHWHLRFETCCQSAGSDPTAALADVGRLLSSQVLPPSLIQALSQGACRGASLVVVDEQHQLPWEMFCIPVNGKEMFIGNAYPIARAFPRLEGSRGGGGRGLIHLAPGAGDLRSIASERTAFQKIACDTGIEYLELEARLQPVRRAIQDLDADILHYSGHGRLTDRLPGQVDLPLDHGDFLSPAQFRPQTNNGALVFLNACFSGRSTSGVFSPAGWPYHLLRWGARAVLGNLLPVQDQYAAPFAKAFYEHLFDGETPERAVWRARQRPLQPGDYSRYFYTLYISAPPW